MTGRSDADADAPRPASRLLVVPVLGVTQIFAWGTSYYLPAVLALPISRETGWSLGWVVSGLSLGLVVAGLVSPRVGATIAARGGRPVLATSACLLAAGLLLLALATTFPLFLLAWTIIGLGMGTGLYDPAFATLGRLYGQTGRSAITTLTLFGGFASTLCWPLSALLEARFGWRTTCIIYASLQMGLALPLYLFALPREPRHQPDPAAGADRTTIETSGPPPHWHRYALLAVTISLASVLSTAMSVHLLTILTAKGLDLATAVGLGALVGPAQVGARTIEMIIARYHHPIWTKLAATSLVTTGLATLWFGAPLVMPALLLYGAGIGLESIARGTLPLAMFGPRHYPAVMGRIAMPSLMAQAAAPAIGAVLLQWAGPDGALAGFCGLSACNVLLVACLFAQIKPAAADE